MNSEDSVSEITADLRHLIGLPETVLIHRVISYELFINEHEKINIGCPVLLIYLV